MLLNKLVRVKIFYSQNFLKYDPRKSNWGISKLAKTWLRIIENIHLLSDLIIEKDAHFCGNVIFLISNDQTKFKHKKPLSPTWTFF